MKRWSGKATRTTETFQVRSDNWRISWETTPGEVGAMNFQICVHKAGFKTFTVVADVTGADQDSIIMQGAGDYYLTITTTQSYTVTVETRP